jgi:hypothetical protein
MSVFESMKQHNLLLYYKDYLNERKTFFCYKIPTSKIMKWSKKCITFPLTKITNVEHRKAAVRMYKSI